jgi:hypothetical protein
MSLEEQIESTQRRLEKYRDAGRVREVEMMEDELVLLKRKWKKEKEKIKPHPAYVASLLLLHLGVSEGSG